MFCIVVVDSSGVVEYHASALAIAESVASASYWLFSTLRRAASVCAVVMKVASALAIAASVVSASK